MKQVELRKLSCVGVATGKEHRVLGPIQWHKTSPTELVNILGGLRVFWDNQGYTEKLSSQKMRREEKERKRLFFL